MLPASTGFGVILTSVITGGFVSKLTVRVTVVSIPAAEVATNVNVFAPSSVNVTFPLNEPSEISTV